MVELFVSVYNRKLNYLADVMNDVESLFRIPDETHGICYPRVGPADNASTSVYTAEIGRDPVLTDQT